MEEKLLYLQINDWEPFPAEAERILNDLLEFSIHHKDEFGGDFSAAHHVENQMIEDNGICVHSTIYDQSEQFWIVCKKAWLENMFPELLEYAKEEPYDDLFEGDRKFFPRYCEENFGAYYFTEEDFEEDERFKSRCIGL